MHRNSRLTAVSMGALCALAGLSATAWAQPGTSAQTERLAYSVMVGGLHVGDAVVELSQGANTYSSGLKLTARGIAKWLGEFRADLSSEGAFSTGEEVPVPRPTSYRREWSGAEIESSMIMTYDPTTRMTTTQERYVNRETREEVKQEDLPWNKNDRDKPDRKKPVTDQMKTDAVDPMAAFIAARQQVIAQGGSKAAIKFRVPVYDGQRRYDVVGSTSAPRPTTINGKTYDVVQVNATLVPIAGFSPRGEERMHDSRGKLLFTADDRFIPVQVTIENELLSGVMNLTADCKISPAACSPAQQEQAASATTN